jgi:hypothetical protein
VERLLITSGLQQFAVANRHLGRATVIETVTRMKVSMVTT